MFRCVPLSILFLLFLFHSYSLKGGNKSFHTLTKQDGLPSNHVNYVMEDHKGFMWIGTNAGLCRYDGVEFKIWTKDTSGVAGPKGNEILRIDQARDGLIWVGVATKGLAAYDPKSETWYNWEVDTTGRKGSRLAGVNDLAVIGNEVWFSSGWYLQRVRRGKDGFEFATFELKLFPGHEKPLSSINRIIQGNDPNILWLATSRGIVGFDRKNEGFLYGNQQESNEDPLAVGALVKMADGSFLVGYEEGGVAFVKANAMKPGISPDPISNAPWNLSKGGIEHLAAIGPDEALISTRGLTWLAKSDSGFRFEAYLNSAHLPSSIPDVEVKHVIADKAGNWWLATKKGLAVYYPAAPAIHRINKHTLSEENFDNRIYRIHEDQKGRLWFGGQDGLYRYTPESGELKRIILEGEYRGKPGFIAGIDESDDGTIWVAVAPYLYKLDPEELSFRQFDIRYPRPKQVDNQFVADLTVDENGKLWLGTAAGFSTFDPNREEWRVGMPNYMCFFLGIEPLNEQYMAAVDGNFLFKIDRETYELISIEKDGNSLDNKVSYLKNTRDLLIVGQSAYLSDANGLKSYNFETETWKEYSLENGLPDNMARGLEIGADGMLWCSTDYGIARLNPQTGEINSIQSAKQLPCLSFNSRASEVDQKGRIYFGCDEGIIFFEPDVFRENKYQPPVHITKVSLYNEELQVVQDTATGAAGLSVAPAYLDQLVLKHNQSVISFNFAALNYLDPKRNQYSYRLVGLRDEWITNGNSTSATFTNLDPGEYKFEVKATNNSGIWSHQVASLSLIVTPPWFATWWAYLIYLALATALFYLFLRIRLQRVRQQAEVERKIHEARMSEREEFRKQSAADFHDEAGNKLTKINLFTSLAREQLNGNLELNKYLGKIEQNTKELSAGMRDFLWVMDPAKDSLFDTMVRLQNFGESMFGETKTSFKVKGLQARLHYIPLDMTVRRAIMQIFKEGMNNVAKHANASQVLLSVKLNQAELQITLEDNGCGFREVENNKAGYGTGIMQQRARKIGAELCIESESGKGTRLQLAYKLTQMGRLADG